jgi:hypothetical protein
MAEREFLSGLVAQAGGFRVEFQESASGAMRPEKEGMLK